MRRLGDNFSTLTAPFVIVLTFGQTLGSLLDLECPWLNLLREWMQMLEGLREPCRVQATYAQQAPRGSAGGGDAP